MDHRKNKGMKNARNKSSNNGLKNHNEKRKAQDSGNNELKDTQKFNKFD